MECEQMYAIYRAAKAIYNKEERLADGKEMLFQKHGVNKNSFADYYRAFQKMLDGELHTRSISSALRDYFLSQIYKDYGAEKLRIALKAYRASILYYEGTHNNRRREIEWDVYQRYCDILGESHSCGSVE